MSTFMFDNTTTTTTSVNPTLTVIEAALVRTFEVALQDGWDGRTLEARIVPYNEPATVSDPPYFEPYREMFMPGAFTRQLSTPGRDKVLLNFEHEVGIRGVIGQSLSFRERDDGLYGSFGVHENTDGDKALEMINTGLLTGLSAEFRPTRGGSRRVDGVVQRLRAQLDKVSLCRYPAYQAAQVLAVREEPDDPPPPEFAFDRSTDVDQRLAALGFERLKRAATTSKPWDGSPARFTDEQYRASALFCRGGDGPVKELCSLPVKEPDGTVNVNALGSAAAALAGARGGVRNVPREQKTQAARKLIRLYGMANLDPPPALVALARS